MKPEDTKLLIERIEKEIQKERNVSYSAEGMLRLQETLRQYDGEYRLIWSEDLAKELEKRPKTIAHPTGIDKLDELIGGFRPQQLITLSAHSKHGKTSMAMFMVENAESLAPVVIPLEQSNEEIIEQRKENGYSIPRFLSPYSLASRVTVEWIEHRIIEGIAKYNTKLVVIDHLGYIDDLSGDKRVAKENLAYRIQLIMQSLKNLAKKWNVTIMILVHISQSDEGKPPSLVDLKGSSSILQESDLVIMLWRKNTLKNKVRIYENKTMMSVLANRRNGKNGNVGLVFDNTTGKYRSEQRWVDSMESAAQSSVDADNEFNDL